MSTVSFIEGKPQEFVAEISFNLNLENKKSSKVHKGDTILYDGRVASYTSSNGISITGESRSLRSAINAEWLSLKKAIAVAAESKKVSKAKKALKEQEDFDNKKGGNFDTFIKNDGKIISREKDLIVKETTPIKKNVEKPESTDEKLKVAGDQVAVKKVSEPFTVSNSTAIPRTKTHSKIIQTSEAYGADSTMPRGAKKASEPEATQKKKAFTVDASTPPVHEEATLEEVKQAKGVEPMDNQEAKVVKKIKQPMQVQQMDGVTLKKVESPKDMSITTKVSSGGESAVDIASSSDTKVIKKASEDYSSILPSDWGTMHWVKKEKWIKAQTNKKLLEFLLSVENVNAVLNACKERLKEIG